MTTYTAPLPVRRTAPGSIERLTLAAARALEQLAGAFARRSATINPVTEKARADADDRRRTAQALGSLGLLPR